MTENLFALRGTFTEIPLTDPLVNSTTSSLFTLHFPLKPGKVATAVDGGIVASQVVADGARVKPGW